VRTLIVIILLLLAAFAATLYLRPDLRREMRDLPPVQAVAPNTTTAYKWQDAQGRWHITDKPPAKGIPYQTLTVHSDTNVLPPLPEKK